MPDRWLHVSVVASPEWQSDLFAEVLLAAGASGIEHQSGRLATYFSPPVDPREFIERLSAELAAVSGELPPLSWEWRADADWAKEWRRGLGPRRIGERLLVTPSWIRPEASPSDIVITIDPQMAFGTGEHATTRSVLRLLEIAIRPNAVVLDVGTGSGILAIAAARLGAAHVDGVENDADALINAEENLAENRVREVVSLRHRSVDDEFLRSRAGAYQLILANVLSGVLRPLLPAFREALASQGSLILGGILASEAEPLRAAARAAGFRVRQEEWEEEWWSVLLERS